MQGRDVGIRGSQQGRGHCRQDGHYQQLARLLEVAIVPQVSE